MIRSSLRNRRKARGQRSAPSRTLEVPTLEDCLSKRDFSGALALLDYDRDVDKDDAEKSLWIAYCAFHLGDLERAQNAYIELLSENHETTAPKDTSIYIACVYYAMQMFSEAEEFALAADDCALKTRILYQIALKTYDESKAVSYKQQLGSDVEDKLCLAAGHFSGKKFQEATDLYKRLLIDNRDSLALNVYVAMCYFKLDYYEVSLEILTVYDHFDSVLVSNLKACNSFRLFNGKAALDELKKSGDLDKLMANNDLIRHNHVVFTDGENAMQVLPPLLDFIPEAKLNLAIYHLQNDDIEDAHELLHDIEPSTPQEYILKAIVNANLGQAQGDVVALRTAQKCFQAVGTSPSECDTIPGRQCMASCFFLLKQFEDVNVYLNSVKSYMSEDDCFNWNYGISLASTGNYETAEEALLLVEDELYQEETCYNSWLARCFIMNGKPEKAWDLYLKMETTTESFQLLEVIGNDSYRMGHFLFAAKAFNVLGSVDPGPEFWDAKRGSCVGVFQEVLVAKEGSSSFPTTKHEESIAEVLSMLRSESNKNGVQAQHIANIIRNGAKEMGIHLKFSGI